MTSDWDDLVFSNSILNVWLSNCKNNSIDDLPFGSHKLKFYYILSITDSRHKLKKIYKIGQIYMIIRPKNIVKTKEYLFLGCYTIEKYF